jgi:hypothetical protein
VRRGEECARRGNEGGGGGRRGEDQVGVSWLFYVGVSWLLHGGVRCSSVRRGEAFTSSIVGCMRLSSHPSERERGREGGREGGKNGGQDQVYKPNTIGYHHHIIYMYYRTWPLEPSPQVNTAPVSSRARTWKIPHDTAVMCLPCNIPVSVLPLSCLRAQSV